MFRGKGRADYQGDPNGFSFLGGKYKPLATALSSKAENLWKTYDMGEAIQVHASAVFRSRLSRGEYVAIMGPSAPAMSTLMNLIGLPGYSSRGAYWLETAPGQRAFRRPTA